MGVIRRAIVGFVAASLANCTGDELNEAGKVAACSIGAGGVAFLTCSVIANKKDREVCIYAALATATAAGIACYFVFFYKNTEVNDYDTTKAISKYAPKKGTVLRVTELTAVPSTVSPGGNTTIKATYSVMTPDAEQDIPIAESWEFHAGDRKPEVVSRSITIKPGTRQAEGEIPIPDNAAGGAYRIVFTATTPDGMSDKRETRLNIIDKTALLPHSRGITSMLTQG